MTEHEFVDKVSKIVPIYRFVENKAKYSYDESKFNLIKNPTIDDYLYMEWHTGGVSGGSCWESSSPQSYSLDVPEPDFTSLDDVLLIICPNIPYLQYKSILSLISYDYRTEYEYYGNSEDYSNKKIQLKKLYDKLKEFNLL